MGFLIFGFFILVLLAIGGGVAVWKGYEASREAYYKARRWERDELRPRKYATGLSRKPPREGRGRRPIGRYRGERP